MFEDCGPDRKLTGFLLRYLLPGYSLYEQENIKYYLEVKTTLGDCSNKFFLSKAQHLRTRICVLPWSTDHRLIYSGVDEENGPGTRDPSERSLCDHAGLQSWSKEIQYYVDPWAWKVRGDLTIEPESYTATEAQ